MIDEELYRLCKETDWGTDFVSQYKGIPVSGASSYTSYADGIEIEIDTKEGTEEKDLLMCAEQS